MTVRELSQLYFLNREIEIDKKRLEALDAEIRADAVRLRYFEERASLSGASLTGMPKASGTGSRLETSIDKLVELREALRQMKEARADFALELQRKQLESLKERQRLERFIETLPSSLLRLIFTFRFVDGMTWAEVSEQIGPKTSEDSVKKACYRFLKK